MKKKLRAFTLAEVLSHSTKTTTRHAELVSASHAGFTLAETLITLMIIGVVAVLVIPAFINNINKEALSKQHDVFNKKFTEGLRQMRADGVLASVYTTESFVNEMKKYFKFSQVCNSENLTSCFSSNINVIDGDKKDTFEVSTLKNANNMNNNNPNSEVYGLTFADGVNMLIYYIPGCEGPADKPKDGDPDGNLFTCFKYIYDINGTKVPNTYLLGKDINGTIALSKGNPYGLPFEISEPTSASSRTVSECETFCSEHTDMCKSDECATYNSKGYWIDAAMQCANKEPQGTWRLPSSDELTEIGKILYGDSNFDASGGSFDLYFGNPDNMTDERMGEIEDCFNNGNNCKNILATDTNATSLATALGIAVPTTAVIDIDNMPGCYIYENHKVQDYVNQLVLTPIMARMSMMDQENSNTKVICIKGQ